MIGHQKTGAWKCRVLDATALARRGAREGLGKLGMKLAFLAACVLAIFLSGYPYNLMGMAMLGVSVLVECFVALTRPPL